ncbi:MAG TPA: asparagine synthase-related protein [Vicinamibacterales bacterium]|nr:asparagine synthase-related protein [Vicinamibacterales bacterium]
MVGALAGVLFFDRRPVDEESRALSATLAAAVPDGVSTFVDTGVVLVHGAVRVWADHGASCLVRRSQAGLTITWDGRLDNRDDLLLQLDGHLPHDRGDAAIALSVFERWGIDGLRLLIGDWSAAIWDSRNRTLHLARDYMGVRPLYYYTDARSVRWSSSLGELATRTGCIDALDERFIARFMAWRCSTDVTPYDGIRAVPTAQCVSLSPTGTETVRRFWCLEPGLVRYRDRRTYEERLRALWSEAVVARLRSPGTVWAELSGGLDSSSVVCMANALIASRRAHATALRTVSHVAVHSPEGDERRFIAEVERRIGIVTHTVGVEASADARDADSDWVTPCAPRGVRLAAARYVQEQGGRVILSGGMGDAIMGCSPDNSLAVFDELMRGRILTTLVKARSWSRATQKPFVEIVCNLVREAARGSRTYAMDHALNEYQRAGIELLAPRLRATAVEPSGISDGSPRVPLSQREWARMVIDHSLHARLEAPTAMGMAYAYPFAHRPLVEYMLAIPSEELSAPGRMRSLMRRAFEGLVPARVLSRVSKGYYPPAMTRAVRAVAVSLLPVEGLEVVRRGWIDAARLESAIAALMNGGGRTAAEVRLVLQLEEWMTSRNRRALAATPQRKEVTHNGVLIA